LPLLKQGKIKDFLLNLIDPFEENPTVQYFFSFLVSKSHFHIGRLERLLYFDLKVSFPIQIL
jgi:hypothetical protein